MTTELKKRRSVDEMLADMPTPEHRAVYAMARIDAIQEQMLHVLDVAGPEVRAMLFARNARADRLWHLSDLTPRPKTKRSKR